ncbi:DNA polymerase III subunit beta [Pseudomonas sp. NPDC089569]|uniref:DNA polymerase III subunit beta n=1 Tax=Pseudomonas sp. NPDC089569 TaxID=3390722 RepID=UPI003CFC3FC1
MKLTISVTDFANVLKQVCRVALRSSGDILGQVLLDATATGLTISAQNGKQQMTMSPNASALTVEVPGAICVNAAKLDQVILSLPKDKPVSIVLKDDKLQISSGRSRFNLVTTAAVNFPSVDFPVQDVIGSLKVAGGALTTGLRQVGFCAGRNDVRYYLNGVLFDLAPDSLTLAATDGHRLGVTEVPVNSCLSGQFILPSTCIEDVAVFCGTGDVEVSFSKQMVRYTTHSGVLFSRLIDGTFPKYKNLLTNAAQGMIARVDRNEIASAVARVTLLSDSKIPAVKLTLTNDEISIQSISADVLNEANDVLPCSYKSEPLEIGMNGAMTTELLRALGSEEVDLYFRNDGSGTLFTTKNYPSHSFVLMPVRL